MLTAFAALRAQCPVNIGFEMGDFTRWNFVQGTFLSQTGRDGAGILILNDSTFDAERHTIIPRSAKQVDPYGGFALASPNGSDYVVRLGNNDKHSHAQRLSYTFTVPANNNEYSLIYYYALVLQDPTSNHTDDNKPKFTASVFNVTDNTQAGCGNFNFVSARTLPGFMPASNGYNNDQDVFYKSWSAVTIDLRGYAGKTLRLDFTTNDCAPGAHFGYAYIDVNQNCQSPVTGNIVCDNKPYVTLVAPSGFKEYHWYHERDFTAEIQNSNSNTYIINPTPPVGAKYSVVIVPYPGIGCQDTVTTTIKPAQDLALKVIPSISNCRGIPANLKDSSITAGSDPSYTFTYYNNADGAPEHLLDDPANMTDSGTYYIKATGACEYILPIKVSFKTTPTLVIHNPTAVCAPATVDITDPAIIAGSTGVANPTYWTDIAATKPVTDPQKISRSGSYYVKSVNNLGCYDIQPITVLINDLPKLVINTVYACETADITSPAVTAGSTNANSFYYFTNAACTDTLPNPKAITVRGKSTYYIKAYSEAGCFTSAPVDVYVYDYPQSTITNPPAVVFPATVDITHTFTRQPGTQYYFYIDSLATRLIPDATKVGVRGTYYVRAVNGNNCAIILPIYVAVNPPPVVDYGVNTFTPNGDGKNDLFLIKLNPAIKLGHMRIYTSWGAEIFDTTSATQAWDGTYNGKKMPVGTYYWILDGYDTYLNKPIKQSGSVTIIL